MIIPTNDSVRIAKMLVQMDESGAHPDEILGVLRRIDDPNALFDVAGDCVHSLNAMRMIYRRAEELKAAGDRARGFLALAHLFAGDDETAKAIIGSLPPHCTDSVLWQAWSLTTWDVDVQIQRLLAGIENCPNPKRLWQQLATTALDAGRDSEAARAHQWLMQHENDPGEVQRLRQVMSKRGWLREEP